MNPLNLKPKRLSLILGAFLAFLVIIAPQVSKADDCDSATGAYQQNYTNNLHHAIQRISQVKHDHLNPKNGFAKVVDTQMDYCLDKIEALLDVIANIGNPKAIVMAIVSQLIIAFFTQLCNYITGVIGSVLQGVLSLFNQACIPIPQLHLPGLSLNWGGSCTGVNLLPLTLMPNPNNPNRKESPAGWQMWGGRVRMGP